MTTPIIVRTHEGVRLAAGAGLGQIALDPREMAIAALPDWAMLASPGAALLDPATGRIANRVLPTGELRPYASARRWTLATEGGANWFDTGRAEATGIRYHAHGSVNLAEWSFIAVLYWPAVASEASRSLTNPEPGLSEGRGIHLGLGVANPSGLSTILLRNGDASATIRLQTTARWGGQKVLLVVTSGIAGTRIRVNRVDQAVSVGDNLPLTQGAVTIASGYRGLIGDIGTYNRDLSAPGQDSALAAIEDWFASRAGL